MSATIRLALLLVFSLCLADPASAAEERPISILFLGNSFTYHNNLPNMLHDLGRLAGKQIEVDSQTSGGMTLKDHVTQGHALDKLKQKKYDYVVLQGQSAEPLKDPAAFHAAAKVLHSEIRKYGAKTLLFVTWAPKAHPELQDDINKQYIQLANDLKVDLVPVGPAFGRAARDPSGPRLYDGDGTHASRLGTYTAACVFYSTLYGKSPEGIPTKLFGVEAREVLAVQSAGWAAVKVLKERDVDQQAARLRTERDEVKLAEKRSLFRVPGATPATTEENPGTKRKKTLIIEVKPEGAAGAAQTPPADAAPAIAPALELAPPTK